MIKDEPKSLWDRTKDASGISHGYFSDYFDGKQVGYAIKVLKAKLYDEAKCLLSTYGVRPPQSFQYLT